MESRRWLDRLVGAGAVPVLILIAIVTTGAWLRLDGIAARSFWLDEAMTATFLEMEPSEIVRRCAEPLSVHPPLYYVAARCWATLGGDSEASLRGLSAALGLATIVGCYLLVRDLSRLDPRRDGTGAALLAAMLVALSPMQIELSRTARGYTLVSACLTFGSWALVRALTGRPRWGWWLASALLFAAASYAHYMALLTVSAVSLFAVARLVHHALTTRRAAASGPERGDGVPATTVGSPAWATVAAIVFLVVYALPWFSTLAHHSETIRHKSFSWEISWERATTQTVLAIFSSYDVFWDVDPIVGSLTVLLLVGLFAYLAIVGGWRGLYLVVAGLVPMTLMVAYSLVSNRSIFHARYLCFAQIAWLQGIAVAARDTPSRAARLALSVVLVAASAYACYENRSLLGGNARPGMRAAGHYVAEHRRPGEVFVALSPYAYFGARYYSDRSGRPLLCVLDPHRQVQFGSEHLRDEDLVAPDRVLAGGPPGAWVITTESYDPSQVVNLTFPDGWELVDEITFEQDRWLERPVRVSHYRFREGN